jgi:hypothetical protein
MTKATEAVLQPTFLGQMERSARQLMYPCCSRYRTSQFEMLQPVHVKSRIYHSTLCLCLHGAGSHRVPGRLDSRFDPFLDRLIVFHVVDGALRKRLGRVHLGDRRRGGGRIGGLTSRFFAEVTGQSSGDISECLVRPYMSRHVGWMGKHARIERRLDVRVCIGNMDRASRAGIWSVSPPQSGRAMLDVQFSQWAMHM